MKGGKKTGGDHHPKSSAKEKKKESSKKSIGGSRDEKNKSPAKQSNKRERLRRDPSLEKVDENWGSEFSRMRNQSSTESNPGGFRGVKSYLHLFYEEWPTVSSTDRDDIDGNKKTCLCRPKLRGSRKCLSIFWRANFAVGITLLVCGVGLVIFGYAYPPRTAVLRPEEVNSASKVSHGTWLLIDQEAVRLNQKLDTVKLIGLILFCVGGLIVAVALMVPSFFEKGSDDASAEEDFAHVQQCLKVDPGRSDPFLTNGNRDRDPIPANKNLEEVQPVAWQNTSNYSSFKDTF